MGQNKTDNATGRTRSPTNTKMIFVALSLLICAAYGQHAPPQQLMAVDNGAWMDTFHAENAPAQFGRTIESLPSINELGTASNLESHQLQSQQLRAPEGWFGLQSPINRSLQAAPSFFSLAPQYILGLVTSFAFVFGVILLFDFLLNNVNILQTITGGRAAKAINDLVAEINVNSVVSAADEVYSAVEKYQ